MVTCIFCGVILTRGFFYYASWPLFALSHHCVIWWCAEQVYPGKVFRDYALLGDDVVIADQRVAALYESVLSGVYQKELISDRGAAEFAKKFRVKGLRKDFSPISIRDLLNSHHPFGLATVRQKDPHLSFPLLMRLGGAGFRQLATWPAK